MLHASLARVSSVHAYTLLIGELTSTGTLPLCGDLVEMRYKTEQFESVRQKGQIEHKRWCSLTR